MTQKINMFAEKIRNKAISCTATKLFSLIIMITGNNNINTKILRKNKRIKMRKRLLEK